MSKKKEIRILSIDGGGMRGYIPCAILAEFEKTTGKKCCEVFDIIAGTSIGGIVGALLSTGVPASEVLNFFTDDGPKIFKRRWWRYFGLFRSRYNGNVIEKVLYDKFLNKDVKTRLIIPTLDLASQQPHFFKFEPNSKNTDSLWIAARATSSAQIFFPAFKINLKDGYHVFWDGGNVANNPALCGYVEAKKTWDAKSYKVFSLGCGKSTADINTSSIDKAGAIVNGLITINMLFEAGSEEVDYQMSQILGSNYYRYQPNLTQELSLDGASKEDIENLKTAADACIKDINLQKIFKEFV